MWEILFIMGWLDKGKVICNTLRFSCHVSADSVRVHQLVVGPESPAAVSRQRMSKCLNEI